MANAGWERTFFRFSGKTREVLAMVLSVGAFRKRSGLESGPAKRSAVFPETERSLDSFSSESEDECDFKLLLKKHSSKNIISSDDSDSDNEKVEKQQKRKHQSSYEEEPKTKKVRKIEKEESTEKENLPPVKKNVTRKDQAAISENKDKEKTVTGKANKEKNVTDKAKKGKTSTTQKAEERERKLVQETVLFEQSKEILSESSCMNNDYN